VVVQPATHEILRGRGGTADLVVCGDVWLMEGGGVGPGGGGGGGGGCRHEVSVAEFCMWL